MTWTILTSCGRWFLRTTLLLAVLLVGPFVVAVSGAANVNGDWRTASRDSAGIAPDPATNPEAIIQVYGARAFSWRGAFALHTWIAAKRENAPSFTTYQVIGWQAWRGRPAVVVREESPDRRWFGATPRVLAEQRGAGVEALIDRLEAAVDAYPFKDDYRTWPGPNSNTFTAHIARSVPELGLELPPTAIGKDFLANGNLFAPTPSGTGYQMSLLGLLGLSLGRDEGLEVNLLGLTLGIDPMDLAIKLPAVGRIGLL